MQVWLFGDRGRSAQQSGFSWGHSCRPAGRWNLRWRWVIALVIPSLKDQASVLAAVAAGITSILAAGLPYKLGLLSAALVGIIVGLWSEKRFPPPG